MSTAGRGHETVWGPRASRWCERPVWTWRSGELFGPISRFDDINLERLIDVPEATKAEVDETILFGRTDRAPRARRDTDRTWRRFRLQSGGDVHAVPEDIRPTGHHMAYVHAHPQHEPAKRHYASALVDSRLDGKSAVGGIAGQSELGYESVGERQEMSKPKAPAGYEAHAAIALISEEHRFLRDHFETLQAELEAGIELAVVTDHARRFIAITAKHFVHEEWAMRLSCFPDLAAHQIDHRRFVSDDMLCNLRSSAWRRQERMGVADVYWRWMDRHQTYDRDAADIIDLGEGTFNW